MIQERRVGRTGPDRSSSGGVLIVRVWFEDPPEQTELRIRMIGRRDVSSAVEDAKLVATVADALTYIRAWIEQFAAPPLAKQAEPPEPVDPHEW
jgi:hypothetical protein